MKDARGHGSNGRGGRLSKPIPGHAFHKKSDAELRYIQKDAGEAARATRGMSSYNPNSGKREDTEGKYLDQVNDATSVLGYRDRGGKQDIAAADQLHSGTSKSDAAPTHDSMVASGVRPLYARVSSKNGSKIGEYGPHPTREAAAAEAFAKHPKAKTVSTSYQHGFDIRYHNK